MPQTLARALATLLLVMLVAACGGDAHALGYTQAPAALDQDSPKVAARDIAFDRTDLAVPAGRPFILVFENQEAAAHNVSVYMDASLNDRIFEGVVVSEPATRWYPVPALAPGTYVFQCDIHPGLMVGRLQAS